MTRKSLKAILSFGGFFLVVKSLTAIGLIEFESVLIELPSTSNWYFTYIALSFVWLFLLFHFFKKQKLQAVKWSVVLIMITTAMELTVLIMSGGSHEITLGLVISWYLIPLSNLIFGLMLLFSEARNRFWFRIAGYMIVLVESCSFLTVVWVNQSLTALHDGSATMLTQVYSVLGTLELIPLLISFHVEKREASVSSRDDQEAISRIVLLILIASFIVLFFIGNRLNLELGNVPENIEYLDYEEQLARPFSRRVYHHGNGDSLLYRFLIPQHYDSDKEYPLVISLHGSSGRGNDNLRQVSRTFFGSWLSTSENRRKYPAFLFVPQCPKGMDWGGITDMPAVDSLVMSCISELEEAYSIDTSRIYLTGISMGGFGVWNLLNSWPDKFAAGVPISGAGDPRWAINLLDIPIWAFHGKNDRNVLVRGSRDMIRSMEKAGGNPQYTEYPDLAHYISGSVSSTPGLLDWLFAQEKEQNKD